MGKWLLVVLTSLIVIVVITTPFNKRPNDQKIIVDAVDEITIHASNRNLLFSARYDTGADRSAIDEKLVKELNLKELDESVPAEGPNTRTHRKLAKIFVTIKGKRKTIVASIADRSHLRHSIRIARPDLEGFLVNPTIDEEYERALPSRKLEPERGGPPDQKVACNE